MKWVCEVDITLPQNLAQQSASSIGFSGFPFRPQARWHGLYPRSFLTASRYFKRVTSKAGWPGLAVRRCPPNILVLGQGSSVTLSDQGSLVRREFISLCSHP